MLDNPQLTRGRDFHKSGAFKQAEDIYRDVLASDPTNIDALHLLGTLLHQTSRTPEGLTLIQKALDLSDERWDIRMNFGVILSQDGDLIRGAEELEKVYKADPKNESAFQNLIGILRVLRRYDEALERLADRNDDWALKQLQEIYSLANCANASVEVGRTILERHPEDVFAGHQLRRALAVSSLSPKITDIFPRVKLSEIGQHMIVVGMRKSASTFVSNVIGHVTGFEDLPLASGFDHTYDFIDRELFEAAIKENTVSHTHCPAHEENIQVFQVMGIVPVVVTRNIFDNVCSYLDWRFQTNFLHETVYKEYQDIAENDRISFIIDTFVIRQLEFFASWFYAEKANRLPFIWAPFEDMVDHKAVFFSDLLTSLNMPTTEEKAKSAVEIIEKLPINRFNKGIKGRGKALLNDEAKGRIQSLTRYFPSVDFSRIGL